MDVNERIEELHDEIRRLSDLMHHFYDLEVQQDGHGGTRLLARSANRKVDRVDIRDGYAQPYMLMPDFTYVYSKPCAFAVDPHAQVDWDAQMKAVEIPLEIRLKVAALVKLRGPVPYSDC